MQVKAHTSNISTSKVSKHHITLCEFQAVGLATANVPCHIICIKLMTWNHNTKTLNICHWGGTGTNKALCLQHTAWTGAQAKAAPHHDRQCLRLQSDGVHIVQRTVHHRQPTPNHCVRCRIMSARQCHFLPESTGIKIWVHKRYSELAISAQNITVTVLLC